MSNVVQKTTGTKFFSARTSEIAAGGYQGEALKGEPCVKSGQSANRGNTKDINSRRIERPAPPPAVPYPLAQHVQVLCEYVETEGAQPSKVNALLTETLNRALGCYLVEGFNLNEYEKLINALEEFIERRNQYPFPECEVYQKLYVNYFWHLYDFVEAQSKNGIRVTEKRVRAIFNVVSDVLERPFAESFFEDYQEFLCVCALLGSLSMEEAGSEGNFDAQELEKIYEYMMRVGGFSDKLRQVMVYPVICATEAGREVLFEEKEDLDNDPYECIRRRFLGWYEKRCISEGRAIEELEADIDLDSWKRNLSQPSGWLRCPALSKKYPNKESVERFEELLENNEIKPNELLAFYQLCFNSSIQKHQEIQVDVGCWDRLLRILDSYMRRVKKTAERSKEMNTLAELHFSQTLQLTEFSVKHDYPLRAEWVESLLRMWCLGLSEKTNRLYFKQYSYENFLDLTFTLAGVALRLENGVELFNSTQLELLYFKLGNDHIFRISKAVRFFPKGFNGERFEGRVELISESIMTYEKRRKQYLEFFAKYCIKNNRELPELESYESKQDWENKVKASGFPEWCNKH